VKLLTDNGTHFSANIVQELLAALQVKKLWTTAYHPQTDGQVERFNRFLANALAINSVDDDWDICLPL
jgi:transposase InsO family protein